MVARIGDLSIAVRSVDDLEPSLRRHQVALLRRGVAALVPEIMVMELPRQNPHGLWMRWQERARGAGLRHSEMV